MRNFYIGKFLHTIRDMEKSTINRLISSQRYKVMEKNVIEKIHEWWERLIACLQQKCFFSDIKLPLGETPGKRLVYRLALKKLNFEFM